MRKRLPGSSESGFLRSLEDFSVIRGRVGVINDTAFSIAFKEWKFCRHELDVLQSKDFMECPTCAVFQHSAHVDGNAKLYRYKSAGRKKRESYYGEKFILDNVKVDKHLANLYENANQPAQLLRGMKMFQAATKGDYADFLDDSAVEATEVDAMDEQSDSVEVDWEDISFDLSNPDFMAESLSMCEQPATIVDGDVCKWLFPPEFCHSSIDGRNGSNSCSVISLAVTNWFLTSNGNFPGPGALSSEWINRFHLCMILEKKPCAALFIYDDKTVSFLVCQSGSVLFVNSHSHPPYGAAVILASNLSPRFFSCVAEIALLSNTTFGNFSRIAV
ncbi:unnamed protein product [Porites evermanni]|uniref:Uncharacterized protein n=1 Tax=Porites evermanni TaxID=104178 RepID=A0ABN8LMD1_9CNID|nr:unnamed protein product [Porites evermanni]